MTHRWRCRCGKLAGEVDVNTTINRGICYCKDCQAFAYFLRAPERILDAQGGTDIVQTSPQALTFTAGREHLACMGLTPHGLMRWYAACCSTAIGNTTANYRLSFVGLIHDCLANSTQTLDASFGPVLMRVNTQSAAGEPKPSGPGVFGAALRLGGMMLKARITGAYRRTPFFSERGEPIARPKVLTADELRGVMADVARRGARVAS
jgi:Family of unknown function (DUF6151)